MKHIEKVVCLECAFEYTGYCNEQTPCTICGGKCIRRKISMTEAEYLDYITMVMP